ncbi:MAG TPA: ABC transporter permease subunit [Candidatus Thermoplasmatota archaeon]|nr:ABC transporter permease subunit [Candidatus Thermoplasmatota archaeon]
MQTVGQRILDILRFRITIQTIKDYWKSTLILTLLFSGMAALYAGMFPAFEEMMVEMGESGALDSFAFIPGYEDMASYVGFLNIEMYQIFWVLILGIIIGFLAASSIAKEIESKTIDILMSNPVSRKQIIIEKFLGLLPMVLIINFVAMLTVMMMTIAIGEDLNFWNLILTHLISLPYFFSIIAIGLFISTLFDEKMKASVVMMAIVVAMFIFDSISEMIPDYETLGLISLKHYFQPYNALKLGQIDATANLILIIVTIIALIAAMFYFDWKDITF